MDKTEKQEMVGSLAKIFKSSQVGFLVDYCGLTVAEVTDLRRRLHETSTNMKVLKNRLARIAIKDTPFEPMAEQLTDTRAIVYGDEPAAPAKVITKFQEQFKKFSIKQGFLVTKSGGDVLDVAMIKALGKLPSRDELLAQVLMVMNAPLTNFVRTLNEIPVKFIRTLSAIAQAKENG